MNLTFNGETLYIPDCINEPIHENINIIYNHFSRYHQAIKSLDININDLTLDASCGTGYGSYLISKKSGLTFGLEINQEFIDIAKEQFGDYAEFYLYNDFQGKANKIVCIETFEHIPKEDIYKFIKSLMDKLYTNGSMFVTFPIGNDDSSDYNPFHCNEPSIDTVYKIFTPYFTKINIEIDSFVNSFGYETKFACVTLLHKKEVEDE